MPFRKKQDLAAVERLREVSFFEGFTDDELERVAKLVEERDLAEGTELMDQGRPGQECYVIADGTASVMVGGEYVANLGPGETVGEMALLDHQPRSATVVADGPMRVLALNADHFRTLLSEMPKANQKIMTELNARLRRQNLGG